MVSALNGFGLAIGCVDITGAVFFELMIICILWRRNGIQTILKSQTQLQQQHQQVEEGYVAGFLGNRVSPWMLWTYLLLLNVWIVVSLLMVTGIILHMPQLLLLWLLWCLGGLIFDVVFLLLWIFELFFGDSIEALTNILISLLAMGKFQLMYFFWHIRHILISYDFLAIEFGFIYVIYNIYQNLMKASIDNQTYNNPMLHFLF